MALLLLKRSLKKPEPNNPSRPKLFRTAAMLLGRFAFALTLASAVATTQTANALGFATSQSLGGTGIIRLSPGVTLQILQWLIVGISVLFQLSLSSMFNIDGKVNAAGILPLPVSAVTAGPPVRNPPPRGPPTGPARPAVAKPPAPPGPPVRS
ncbi:hypothetical protein F4779DRAFT_164925 [Xylariaceae sp. FL0662B]|nr:hypothetical protein F4779DRAFT_164925 [Xylariaceae sp. FL0662B]